MKFTINSILLLSVFILVGCCKEKEPAIPYFDFVIYWEGLQEDGSAEADVFDKNWKASAYILPAFDDPNFFSIYLETYTNEGFLREQVAFGALNAMVGKYEIVFDTSKNYSDKIINGVYSQYTDDGDVLYGGYQIDKDYDNVLYIDKVDTINHLMEGRFNLMFDLDEADYDKDLARKVLFENGKFSVKI